MSKDTKVAFRLSPELLEEVQKIKKEYYFDTTYSEMLRALIQKGITAYKEGK